jgi:succinate dehydrogenase/fumarate reductase-like Fe-S protein
VDQLTDANVIPIYIMNKLYYVPDGLSIMRAMEHAGYRLVRGVGCRGGFCGACATTYRVEGRHRLHMALACQDLAVPNMHLTQLPYFPARKATYNLEEIADPALQAIELYPELANCIGCNTCNKACPQGLKVMEYVAAMLRGDLAEAAELSFDCVMCGLCTARCPAEITQYQAAMYARRAYGRFASPPPRTPRRAAQGVAGGEICGRGRGPHQARRGRAEEALRRPRHGDSHGRLRQGGGEVGWNSTPRQRE